MIWKNLTEHINSIRVWLREFFAELLTRVKQAYGLESTHRDSDSCD